MKRRNNGVASMGAAAVVTVVLALGPVGMAASPGSADAGRKLYLESCQNCHGPAGKGDSDMAAYLTPPPANLTARKTQDKSDAVLRTIILEGRPGTAMSSYDGAFEDAQLADLIAYIRSLKP